MAGFCVMRFANKYDSVIAILIMNPRLYIFFGLWACLSTPAAFGQVTGGQYVFQTLGMSTGARLTALGGTQIAVKDDDLVFAAANPAALNPSMSGRMTFNHNFYLSDIQHGYAAYAQQLPKWGFTVHGALQYLDFGDLKRADEFGNVQGEVKAAEQQFMVGAAKPLSEKVSLGLNVRLGNSVLDTYRSTALSADAGLLYADSARRFTAAIVLKNAGTQISTYGDTRESLPFDVQIGLTKRLKHLPFRLGVVLHHLHDWDIRYNDPNADDDDVLLFGEEQQTENKLNTEIDNFFRHLIFNGEFLLGKNEVFRVRVGYNHLRKRELSVRNYRSLAGFSGGVGVKIKRFRIDVGFATYHLAGGVLHLGVGTNLRDFF
jgi:hypothetical protein